MDTRTAIKQVALSLFARRKKWIVLTTFAGLVLLLPAAYLLSKEPPRYRTTATILIETKAERGPVFQEFSPYRPLPVQLAILQSRLLAASVVEALPKSSVDDLLHNPYGRDYVGDFMDWASRLRGKETAVDVPQRRAVSELRRDRVRFVSQPGATGIVEIQAEASHASDRSRHRQHVHRGARWPAPGPSTSTTPRARGSTCPSRRPRWRTRWLAAKRPSARSRWLVAVFRSRPRARRPPSASRSSRRLWPRYRPTRTSARPGSPR